MAGTYQYSVRSDVAQYGTVSASTSSGSANTSGSCEAGNVMTFTATPKSGYAFDHWEYNGSSATLSSESNPLHLVMPEYNISVTAFFKVKTCQISISTDGEGTVAFSDGTTATKTVAYGTSVTVIATANPGWKHSYWMYGNTRKSVGSTYTFSATDDVDIVAVFYQLSYGLKVETSPALSATFNVSYGSTNVNATRTYNASSIPSGTEVSLSLKNHENGYDFLYWSISNLPNKNDYFTTQYSTFSFDMPAGDTTWNVGVLAVFRDNHAITFSSDSKLTAQTSGNTVTLMFTGTCTDKGNDNITFDFYKSGSRIPSDTTLSFPSGRAIGASECTQTVTLTESELSRSNITFKVVASCSRYSSHSKSLSINFDPQSGSSQGSEQGSGGSGSAVINSGFELCYRVGAGWVPIIAHNT